MSYDDDDADTNLRQAALCLASSTACCMLLSCSDTSSLMHVIHVCRPRLLSPSIWQCNAVCCNRSPSVLVTCPNHVSCRFLIFWTSDSSCCNILRTVSFLILSLLVTHKAVFPLRMHAGCTRSFAACIRRYAGCKDGTTTVCSLHYGRKSSLHASCMHL